MNERIANLWTDALRSGNYTQGSSALRVRDDNGNFNHCCLGVLCELYHQETGDGNWLEDDKSVFGVGGYAPNDGYLPIPVQKWAGLKTRGGVIFKSLTLANLNDKGLSFTSIASLIDEHREDL